VLLYRQAEPAAERATGEIITGGGLIRRPNIGQVLAVR
jgi:hypothetical protein